MVSFHFHRVSMVRPSRLFPPGKRKNFCHVVFINISSKKKKKVSLTGASPAIASIISIRMPLGRFFQVGGNKLIRLKSKELPAAFYILTHLSASWIFFRYH